MGRRDSIPYIWFARVPLRAEEKSAESIAQRKARAAPSRPPRTMIEAMKSTTPGNCKRLGELAIADRSFEAGVLVGPITRLILAHHIDVGVAGNPRPRT